MSRPLRRDEPNQKNWFVMIQNVKERTCMLLLLKVITRDKLKENKVEIKYYLCFSMQFPSAMVN